MPSLQTALPYSQAPFVFYSPPKSEASLGEPDCGIPPRPLTATTTTTGTTLNTAPPPVASVPPGISRASLSSSSTSPSTPGVSSGPSSVSGPPLTPASAASSSPPFALRIGWPDFGVPFAPRMLFSYLLSSRRNSAPQPPLLSCTSETAPPASSSNGCGGSLPSRRPALDGTTAHPCLADPGSSTGGVPGPDPAVALSYPLARTFPRGGGGSATAAATTPRLGETASGGGVNGNPHLSPQASYQTLGRRPLLADQPEQSHSAPHPVPTHLLQRTPSVSHIEGGGATASATATEGAAAVGPVVPLHLSAPGLGSTAESSPTLVSRTSTPLSDPESPSPSVLPHVSSRLLLTGSLPHMPRKRPRTFYHPVPHIMQWYSWDCGLACVCMILHYYGLTQFNMEDLLRYCKCESIWTIDVAFILRKFLGVDFTYYTRYLGINPEYAGNTFYQDTIDEDQQRVEQLFQVAHRNNVRIIRIALPLLDIKRFVAERKFAIIMLVNARLLRCEYCTQESKRTHCLSYTCLKTLFDTKEYVGHFILVVGYNFILDTFYYRDPALEDELCQIKASVLEKARASDGTDFDSIVVRL